jgi:hypothetical protein
MKEYATYVLRKHVTEVGLGGITHHVKQPVVYLRKTCDNVNTPASKYLKKLSRLSVVRCALALFSSSNDSRQNN